MKKHIVLSVNNNPEYLYYLPNTIWAWRKFGWEPILFYYGDIDPVQKIFHHGKQSCPICFLKPIEGYRSDTVVQVSRLYASANYPYKDNCYIMTGDIDMIPLSDYWKPNLDDVAITAWGHDLTGYHHYPICYIGAPAEVWRKFMKIYSENYNNYIERDLDSMESAKSDDSVKRWVVDQDLVTERINAYQGFVHKHDRGVYENGYPIGRVDRSAWTIHHQELIDCHMKRGLWKDDAAFADMLVLLHYAFPGENFDWFVKYTQDFKKLING